MWKLLVPLSLLQSMTLAGGQMMLKLALKNMGHYTGLGKFLAGELTNWWWFGSGSLFAGATLLWMYILKNFPFSIAYPLSCLSFVFGMIGAWMFLGEAIPVVRWIGIVLILTGAFFIAK